MASAQPVARRSSRSRYLVAGLALLALVAALVVFSWPHKTAPAPTAAPPVGTVSAAAPTYVGAAVCQSCHEAQFKAWSGSHHDQAMQIASEATVLGDFAGAKFKINGVESSFSRRGDKFVVRTDGPDGQLTDYEISHTFGVYPLQQYLIPFPGGRYQVLPIAWDSRAKSDGGQRWFHLYPKLKLKGGDPLHWTGIYHNWALQCAECHSTDLRKGYDAASDSYQTTYSEINVACEACHGQGSKHLEWAGQAQAPYSAQDDKGLTPMKSRWHEAWSFPSADAKFAVRDQMADPAAMNSCAACHARRSTLSEERRAGAPLEDTHRLALPMAPVFHVDGQQREEDYVWTSFLQSKMHQFGVTCMDCHEPHTQKLRAPGNALCTRCHNAAEFDVPKHHQHQAEGKGAQCVTCHMPTQDYMVIHARQDHSMRVPRPDLSLTLGSPNACTQCHTDKAPQWAASAMDRWYGKTWRDRPQFGTTLDRARTQGARALPELLELANSVASPDIVRATALTLAAPYASAATLANARELLKDNDPQVRIAALGMVEAADAANRVLAASPLLADPLRGVRVEAARILADVPDSQIPERWRAARASALREYEEALALEADWPSGNVNLGNLRLRQGRVDEAIALFKRALARDPGLTGAYVNLADVLGQQGRDGEAEPLLRRALATSPRDADVHHALGLVLTRQKERAAALKEFAEAARLAPGNPRYAYVHAVAVYSAGKHEAAMVLLRDADKRFPGNIDILGALLSMSREAGDKPRALRYARQLTELIPENSGLKQLIAELERQ